MMMTYTPGLALGAHIQKDGEKWTLVLVRELHHPPEKVWKALTDPEHLREWVDVLERSLDGQPIGRIVGGNAMKLEGWQRLHAEYGKQFGV